MLPRYLFRFLITYKYLIIFPIAIIEGPVITMLSGFLVSLGYLSFVPAYLLLLSGDIISDSIFYMLGRFGRQFIVRTRIIKNFEAQLEGVEEHYRKHPKKTIVVAKVSYGVGSLFLAAAGASKMAYGKFLEYISVPNAVRTLTLLLIGYYFGSAWRHFGTYLRDYALGMLVLLIAGIVVWLFFRRRKVARIERELVKADDEPFK